MPCTTSFVLESGVARCGANSSPELIFGSFPLCWMHHRAYDTGTLELLPHLEPRWRAEVHLGRIGAVRRLAPGRR
jgi:hypothetical protein